MSNSKQKAGKTNAQETLSDGQGVIMAIVTCPNLLKNLIGVLAGNLLHVVRQYPQIPIGGLSQAKFEGDVKGLNDRQVDREKERAKLNARLEELEEEDLHDKSVVYTQYAHALKVLSAYAPKDQRLADALKACRPPNPWARRGGRQASGETEPKK